MVMTQRVLAVEDAQTRLMKAIAELRILVTGCPCAAAVFAKRAMTHDELAPGRDVARPKTIIGKLGQAGEGTEAERIPSSQKDGLGQSRRLDDAPLNRDLRLGPRLMHGDMHLERLPHHEDIVRHH